MKTQWIPTAEYVRKTKDYKYVYGWYDHEKYGKGCFRVSKYGRCSDGDGYFFIGHFVVIPEDISAVGEIMLCFKNGPNGNDAD